MGNRAVITTEENFNNNGVGVYVHWNGGYDSIEAFLKYCELRGFRSPDTDNYGWARLVQVIANFMGPNGLSVGIDCVKHLDCDNFDNGTYLIEGWKIVGRKFSDREQRAWSLEELLVDIDNSQPEDQRIGDYLLTKEYRAGDLDIGDTVYVQDSDGRFKPHKVLDKTTEEHWINGKRPAGSLFFNYFEYWGERWGSDHSVPNKDNSNNYISPDTIVRAIKKED